MQKVTKKPRKKVVQPVEEQGPIRLDLGCGKRKVQAIQGQEPFIGVDCIAFEGVDVVHDLRVTPWPWKDNSVDEVFSSHFLEHLTGEERIIFFNELYRVMKVGGKALIVTPIWSHSCAYGDPTHKYPPPSEWYADYLNEAWREVNAPHVGYTCNFEKVIGYGMEQWLLYRAEDQRQFALGHYVNAARDLHVTLNKLEAK